MSDEEFRRARHVISESSRVVAAVKTMREERFEALGELLTASHRSLADDFEVSIPELDTAVDAAIDAGAYGARMTGAGFGGCAIALVPQDRTTQVEEAVASAFRELDFEPPGFLVAKPSAGAHRID
jgi:galactokinase